jgi:hypothetical protein
MQSNNKASCRGRYGKEEALRVLGVVAMRHCGQNREGDR